MNTPSRHCHLPRQSALKTSANQRLALSGARLSRAAPLVAAVGAGAGAEMLAEDPGKGGVRAEAAASGNRLHGKLRVEQQPPGRLPTQKNGKTSWREKVDQH